MGQDCMDDCINGVVSGMVMAVRKLQGSRVSGMAFLMQDMTILSKLLITIEVSAMG